MASLEQQKQFETLAKLKFKDRELDWIQQKTTILENPENINKFNVFISLTSRFISKDTIKWKKEEIQILEQVYPGLEKSIWTNQDLARVILMLHIETSMNELILENLFEIAEMNELVALYKGLYLLENAKGFTKRFEEGIRTNMVNVFDALAAGNPFASRYLNERAWNQLVLKALFLDRPLYTIQNIDERKNINLANMLQDYVKERWSANRSVSPEIWRMINGYLRDDVKKIVQSRELKGLEKEALDQVLDKKEKSTPNDFWDNIGKSNLN